MSGDFWSNRRAAVAAEAEAELVALREAEAEETEKALADRDDAEILEELGLPEPEALESPEDVREFLASALPQRLKTRALRRLWRLNPVLANLDGLVDYGEDFTDAATVIENLQTAYQVGKGMLAHVEAMAEAKTKAEEDAPPEPEVDVEIEEAEDEAPVLEVATAETHVPPEAFAPEPQEASAPALHRRMQFRFEEPS